MRRSRSVFVEGKLYILAPRLYRNPVYGWTVTFAKNKERVNHYFSDVEYGGVQESFEATMRYLTQKVLPIIYGLPTLQDKVHFNKQSDTPVGISGPSWTVHKDGSATCSFVVSLPVPGKANKTKRVYIGTDNTWMSNYNGALRRAVEIREDAVEDYERAGEVLRLEAIAELDGILESQRPSNKDSRVVHIDFKRTQLLKSLKTKLD